MPSRGGRPGSPLARARNFAWPRGRDPRIFRFGGRIRAPALSLTRSHPRRHSRTPWETKIAPAPAPARPPSAPARPSSVGRRRPKKRARARARPRPLGRRSRSDSRGRGRDRSRERDNGGGEGGGGYGKASGVACRWNERGFGFIKPDDGGDDLFCHVSQITDGNALSEGATVHYVKVFDERRGSYPVTCRS